MFSKNKIDKFFFLIILLGGLQAFNQLGDELRVDFSPDGQTVAIAHATKTFAIGTKLKILNASNGNLVDELDGHGHLNWFISSIYALAYSPDGRILATGGMDQTVKLWDIEKRTCLETLSGFESRIISLAFDASGQKLAAGGDGEIHLWRIRKSGTSIKVEESLNINCSEMLWIFSVEYSPDGKVLATAGGSLFGSKVSVSIFNAENGTLVKELPGHTQPATSVSFSSDGKYLASGARDGFVRIWNVAEWQEVQKKKIGSQVWDVKFAPGQYLLAACGDDTVAFWNIEKSDSFWSKRDNVSTLFSLTFSPDGKKLVTGGGGFFRRGKIIMWQVANAKPLWTQ